MPYEKVGKNEPVCIADEVPFDIPESWAWCRLKTILQKLTDGTHATPKYVEEGIPFISVKDISAGELSFDNAKHISIEEHQELYKRCDPQRGDILLSKVGTTGIPVIVNTDIEFSLFVSVAQLRFSHELMDADFLVWLLKSPLVQKQCTENTRGVGNKNWVMRDIANTLIVIPPLKEQKRIVCAIKKIKPYTDKYTDIASTLDSLNANFPDQLKKSILQMAVQGKLVPQDPTDEPASVLLERIRAEKEQLIRQGKIKRDKHESVIFRRDNSYYEISGKSEVCIDDEIPFDIPESWEWCRLYMFGTFSSGKTPSMSNPDFWNGKIPWVTSKDMKNPLINDSEMHITDEAATSMKLYPAGTLLLVARSGILKRLLPLCKLGVDSTINQDIKAFSLYDLSMSQWLYYAIKAFEPYVLKELVKSITTVESLKFDEFSSLLIPVPPKTEQRRIIKSLDYLMELLKQQSSDPLFLL